MARLKSWILPVVVLCAMVDGRAYAACCRASCVGPVPWVACYADTTSCNTLQCEGGSSTSLAVDAGGLCGVGVFASCPQSEVGRCGDAINNDGWVDAETDLDDPDCVRATPIAGHYGVAGMVAAMLMLGLRRVRDARRSRS